MSNQADEPRRDATPDVDVGMEEPPDDVLEQHRTDTDEDELEEASAADRPIEADPADVEDQRRGVPVEDEQRDG
jgi:hypothetical protein